MPLGNNCQTQGIGGPEIAFETAGVPPALGRFLGQVFGHRGYVGQGLRCFLLVNVQETSSHGNSVACYSDHTLTGRKYGLGNAMTRGISVFFCPREHPRLAVGLGEGLMC